MRNKIIYGILAIMVFMSPVGYGAAEAQHQWEVYSISLTSTHSYQNPYKDIPVKGEDDLLKATFLGISGEALNKEITVTGFWNGGSEWRINFAAPFTGTWTYKTLSRDKNLNGKKGRFEVVAWNEEEKNVNPTRHGFVRVRKENGKQGHYFEYSDGTPFLWVGDTWWNWTNNKINIETFRQMVDNRAEKGFTVGQLFVPGNGWGRPSSLLDESYTVLDPEHAAKVEEMIKYANSKGITVWIHGWWSRENMATNIGEEKIMRWWRYLVHRFGAYNVIWVLAGEYNMYNYGGFPVSFWNNLGNMIKNEDPYERIKGVHNTPPFWDGGAEAPQWATGSVLHNESWADYNQSQVGHGKYANEMIPQVVTEEYNRVPAKPIVVTEPWYEFIEGNPAGSDIRFAAWSAILSGAAGHTYGGGHVWLASVPEAPGGGAPWPYENGFERTTYDYEGAMSMKYLASFFRNVNWWSMEPHPELIKEYPQPFCLARKGEEYVIYLRYGGVAKLTIDPESASYTYIYKWYDPSSGKYSEEKNMQGSTLMSFSCPEQYPGTVNYHDWVLHVKRK